MSKTAIVYQSRYGATKQYAQWLQEEIHASLFERKNVNAEDLLDYDTIVYGGGIYAGSISGITFLSDNYEQIKNKNLILFTCGLGDDSTKESAKNIKAGIDKTLTADMQKNIKVFCLRGYLDYTKLTFLHSLMMRVFHNSMKKNYKSGKLNESEKLMFESYGKKADFSSMQSLTPIIEYINSLQPAN